jgi:hypothetical protein
MSYLMTSKSYKTSDCFLEKIIDNFSNENFLKFQYYKICL